MVWVAAAVAAVRFTLGVGAVVIVPVAVGDEPPAPFLLDTGSTQTVISERLAARIRAPQVGDTRVVTSGGDAQRPLVRVDRLVIGALTVDGVSAIVAPVPGLGVEGVIGQDVLARQNFTLDYQRQRVTWHPDAAGDSRSAVRVPLQRADGRFLVELPQDSGAAALRLVPDSGASAVVVFGGPCGAKLPLDRVGQETMTTLTGAQAVDVGRLRRLRVGAITLRDELAVVMTHVAAGPERGDGLLPLHRFARVTFNVRDGYLSIVPY